MPGSPKNLATYTKCKIDLQLALKKIGQSG
jgi:hypothetical protein